MPKIRLQLGLLFVYCLMMSSESVSGEKSDLFNSHFRATSPVELFNARLTAFQALGSAENAQAEAFLLRTMTIPEKDYKFKENAEFVKSVVRWEPAEILATRDQENLRAVVYQVGYVTSQGRDYLHEISFFNRDSNGYRFTHKINLRSNLQQSLMEDSTHLIRQYGDPVLKSGACEVENWNHQQSEILTQVALLKEALRLTGGVGIAANQCQKVAHPLKIVITGVDYNDEVHVKNALSRYPKTLFPPAQVMLNPHLEGANGEATFDEGCLSLQGPIRASILRPESIKISYLNLSGKSETLFLSGADARVALHELDHIQFGKTYFDHVLADLSSNRLLDLKNIVDGELKSRTQYGHTALEPRMQPSPRLIFVRGSEGKLKFDDLLLRQSLPSYLSSCLSGILRELDRLIEGNDSLSDQEV